MYDINLILSEPKLQAIKEKFEQRYVRGAPGDCWNWRGNLSTSGYGVFKIRERAFRAQRVAYLFHHGHLPMRRPDGWLTFACHHCDNPACVNPAHIFLGSTVDNNHDRHRKGRSAGGTLGGEECGWNKLTEAQVLQIIRDNRFGRLVAKDYGVSESMIYHIRKGIAWKHLPRPS